MAILKSGSTVGGNLILHQGMLPLYPNGDSLFMKNYKVYTEFDKPNKSDVGLGNVTNDAQVKKAGDTMTGDLFIKTAGFRVINNALYLSTEKKPIYLRPQGKDNTIGQISIDINGNTTGNAFLSSGPQSSLANANTRKDYVDQQDQNIINTTPRLDKLDELVNGIMDRRRKKMILHELVIGTDTQLESGETLGNNSLTLGDSDTGLKWVKDGHMQLWSNYVAVADVDQSLMYFNRPVMLRFRNYNGSVNEPMPTNVPMFTIDTTRDESLETHLGYYSNGKFYHYLRGKGQTIIQTEEGLSVTGKTYSGNTTYTGSKPYGQYDLESMVTWDAPDKQTNHLRKVRAMNASTVFHELCVNENSDARLKYSISWFHGIGPDTWLASLDNSGELKLSKGISTWGGSNSIQLNTAAAGAAYIGGNIDGRINAWMVGKTSAGNTIIIYNNLANDANNDSHLMLKPGAFEFSAGNRLVAKLDKTRFELDGYRWARTNDHAFDNQWKQIPPVLLHYGAQSGISDYYPGYSVQSVAEGIGYPTRAEFGLVRDGNTWGSAIIRVGAYDEENKAQGIFTFSVYGDVVIPQVMNSNRIALGGGGNVFDGPSIALGDGDTGILWGGDGWYKFMANGQHIANIDSLSFYTQGGKHITSNGDLNQANDSYSTYVRDIYIRSDIRVKSQLREFDSPSETSKKIQGYLYLQKKGLKQDGSINWEQSAGLIAQEVQEVLPELITVDKDSDEKLLRLNYNGIIALNTATINEHTNQIRSLQDEIKELKQLISKLI